MTTLKKRLVVVSNRLPVILNKDEHGNWEVKPGAGGLVTALNPILSENGGVWTGWIGAEPDEQVDEVLEQHSNSMAYKLKSVPLTKEEEDKYYRGFSNAVLWPLFHDLLGYCRFDRETWDSYQEINERFARVTCESAEPADVVWVHDYQLCLAGHYMRKHGWKGPIAFFLHIPFPSPDLFRRLPWRRQMIKALLEYDLLGFQTLRDRKNFVACVREMVHGANATIQRRVTTIQLEDGREVRVGNWPISIDFDEFVETAKSEEANQEAWYFHEHFPRMKLIMGLDRLDYTKGIPERFRAFERFLEKYPDMQGKVSLYQHLIPSRTHVPDYQDLKNLLDRLVGRINGRFARSGWAPIYYVYGTLSRPQLVGRYKSCEVALITPLRDGMNLVAKEFCASHFDNDGVLILSEFAGAADQLKKGAMLVNPYDEEETADAIYKALHMDDEHRSKRMERLRSVIRRSDVHWWVRQIFDTIDRELVE
ncbi:trehalose-6-phosphate synthase [bacterium]|nr:trehalose-6-phosphate synthase [bacterium]